MAAVVLEEVVDDEYQPSEEEIAQYAQWLDMDLENDKDLLWIALDGLKAPLPDAWRPCQSGDGNIFYFNFETGESVWDHPCDDHFRRLYIRAKAKRDAPLRVVSISGARSADNMLVVNCHGSLNGEELAVLNIKPTTKVRSFRSVLARQLEQTKRKLRIMLPEGRLLTEDDDTSCLATTLGIDCGSSTKEKELSKEARRPKILLKELKVKECLDRCHNLGGLPLGPELAELAATATLLETPVDSGLSCLASNTHHSFEIPSPPCAKPTSGAPRPSDVYHYETEKSSVSEATPPYETEGTEGAGSDAFDELAGDWPSTRKVTRSLDNICTQSLEEIPTDDSHFFIARRMISCPDLLSCPDVASVHKALPEARHFNSTSTDVFRLPRRPQSLRLAPICPRS